MRNTISELWIQIRIAATFRYNILGIRTLVTRELQVACERYTYPTTALISEMYIFCVRARFEIRSASYASKHALQYLSNRLFYAYSVLKRITWKLKVVRERSSYRTTAILSETIFVCFRVALGIRLESFGPRHASVVFWYHILCVYRYTASP